MISFRIGLFDLLVVQGTLKSSSTPQFENISSLVLSLLCGPNQGFWAVGSMKCALSMSSLDAFWCITEDRTTELAQS